MTELLTQPIVSFKDWEKQVETLRNKIVKNDRVIKKVLKPKYSSDLYDLKRNYEHQLEDLFRLKVYISITND